MKMPEALYKQYLQSLSVNVDDFRRLAKELRAGDQSADQKIRAIAHTLHGSGGTFGHPEISAAGKAVEHADAASLVRNLINLVQVLKTVLDGRNQQDTSDTSVAPSQNEAPAPVPQSPSTPDKRPGILLVEDDPEYQQLLKSVFREAGDQYRLVIADTAAKAMDLVLRQKFSLILLDLVLPDRDGREILRSMKYEFSIKTPVFILSAIDRDVVRVECMSLGADKVIVKPFDPAELISNVGNILAGRTETLTLVPIGSETGQVPMNDDEKSRVTILAADDDQMQGKFIRERLGKEGFTVELFDNGTSTLQALARKDYSLLILDVQMPGSNGFEVLKRVRNDMNLPDLPIIMLTAMGSENDIIKAYDLGADDYILKPFSAIQLVARVKSLLKPRKRSAG